MGQVLCCPGRRPRLHAPATALANYGSITHQRPSLPSPPRHDHGSETRESQTAESEERFCPPPESSREVNSSPDLFHLLEESTSEDEEVFALLRRGDDEYEAFFATREATHLDAAIAAEREALKLCPIGHLRRHICLHNLATSLDNRFDETENHADLTEAIQLFQQVLRLLRPDHADYHSTVNKLSSSLAKQLQKTGFANDLVETMRVHAQVTRSSKGSVPLTEANTGLTEFLHTARKEDEAFLATRNPAHLDRAIDAERGALGLRPIGHPIRHISLHNLAIRLGNRFNQSGDINDITEAIQVNREALELLPPEHPNRGSSLGNLANRLSDRFNQSGDLNDLAEAIQVNREALELHPPGHPNRGTPLNNLAIHLGIRFSQSGDVNDITEAIQLIKEALRHHPPGHPHRGSSLGNLANYLSDRFSQTGDLSDITEAIQSIKEALRLHPPGHPLRGSSLGNLANHLSVRFSQFGDPSDITEAIQIIREALELHPPGHPDRGSSLNNLATHLGLRFGQSGDLNDISEAIQSLRESLPLHPPGHPHRGASLRNLADYLSDRFSQSGDLNDITEAIQLNREGLSLRPLGHPDRGSSLSSLATSLGNCFNQSGDLNDIKEAILLNRQALELRPPGHPDRSSSMNNLATHLGIHFNQSGDLNDITEAIQLNREALELRPPGHPDRGTFLNNLANHLDGRFRRSGDLNDITEAIQLNRASLELRPPGHPDHVGNLAGLANKLSDWLDHVEQQNKPGALTSGSFAAEDALEPRNRAATVEDIMKLLREATLPSPSPISHRLVAAQTWRNLSRKYDHDSQLEAMIETLKLVDESVAQARSLQSLYQHVSQYKFVQRTQRVASDATALSIERGDISLGATLLEHGRATIFTQLGRFRQSLDQLHYAAPELAQKFSELSASLNDLIVHSEKAAAMRTAPGDTAKDLGVVYHEQHSEWVRTAAEIRQLSGFESFLGRPSFEHLQQAAVGGPVILLNINDTRSDAIIIPTSGDPILVPLPEATPDAVNALGEELGEQPAECEHSRATHILQEAWRLIVNPIVTQLHHGPIRLRIGSSIWWCASGVTSKLPLHAAGPYSPGEKNLPNLFISSYTPTLGALIRARQSRAMRPTSILVVGQPDQPNESPLSKVVAEVDAIRLRAPHASVLLSSEGTTRAVIDGLQDTNWLHLACHGHHHSSQPFLSRFSLHDGPITLQDLIEQNLPNAEFAFLSACHSARTSEALPDEVLHLTAGMMFAGYKSVIGTMWSFDDDLGSALADEFYRLMLGGKNGPRPYSDSAVALARAFSALDKADREIPLMQRINVVHYGV